MERTFNILLVDNDQAQVKTLSLYLQSEGQNVFATTSPQEALKLIGERVFDLGIVDLVMPEMDGFELVEKCRQKQRKLPFILITGHMDRLETLGDQVQSTFSAVLSKPLDIDRLIEEINSTIRYGGKVMSTKELQENLATDMKQWMKVEDAAVASTGAIIEKTDNPVIRMVMEIIQRDSLMHHRVQDFIKNTLVKEPVMLTPDDLADIWTMVEKHIEFEKRTIDTAKKALDAIKDKKMVVQEYLLNYLLTDERKHDAMLATLQTIKRGMYPYG